MTVEIRARWASTTSIFVLLASTACFAPNPDAESTETEASTTGEPSGSSTVSEGATSSGGSSAETGSGPTTTASPATTTATDSETADGTTTTESGTVSVEGRVFVVNALPSGESLRVCIAASDGACTGVLGPLEFATIEGVPAGGVEVEVTTSGSRQSETQVVTFHEDEPFVGVVAAGAEGTLQFRASGISQQSVDAGGAVVINALVGSLGVTVVDAGRIPPWSSEVLDALDATRLQVSLAEFPYAVTSSPEMHPWAVVLAGDPGQPPDSPDGLGAFFFSSESGEFQIQDGAVSFVAPLVPNLAGPNVVCADGAVLVSNVEGIGLDGPVPVSPDSEMLSLRDGTDCADDLVVGEAVALERGRRYLASFGYGNSVSIYVDDFASPSLDTEYRLLNMHTGGESAWMQLRDGANDSILAVLVAGLPPNGESASFSLDADDATLGTGEYFFWSATSSTGANDAEWGYPHADGNRVWFVVNDGDFFAVDVSVWPWEITGV